ncbi:MAG: hypothetical protein AABY22_14805 [Nanoarchaeota archaeon]
MINNDFFKVIDNQEKAYWLGFIVADGYLFRKKIGNKYYNHYR